MGKQKKLNIKFPRKIHHNVQVNYITIEEERLLDELAEKLLLKRKGIIKTVKIITDGD